MSTRNHFVPLALSLLLGVGACASRQSMGEQVDDATLQMRVGRALIADPDTSAMEIDVDVVDGIVYLNGDVDTEQEKLQAARVASNTVGVREVRNNLQIEGMMPDDEDGRSDIAIRTAVGTRLVADPDADRMNIDVDVVNGVVYLTGVVKDQAAKSAAERIAGGVEGVKKVENQLRIEGEDEGMMPGRTEQPGGEMSEPEGDKQPMDHSDMDMDDETMQPE